MDTMSGIPTNEKENKQQNCMSSLILMSDIKYIICHKYGKTFNFSLSNEDSLASKCSYFVLLPFYYEVYQSKFHVYPDSSKYQGQDLT